MTGASGGIPGMDKLSPERRALLERMLRERGIEDRPASPGITPRQQDGPSPLSLNQEGIWFIHQLDPERPAYNIPGVVRLQGPLEVGALEKTLEILLRRHDALRTVFELNDTGVPVQTVTAPGPFELPVVDLSALTEQEQASEIQRRAQEDAETPFDLARGPLFTAFLLKLSDVEHVLVLKVHHLVIDGWSWGIVTEELKSLYRSQRRGVEVDLPRPELQYVDFAVWQRDWLSGDRYDELVRYWSDQLRDLQPLALPTDHPRPSVQSFRGKHQRLHVAEADAAGLRSFARSEGHTLFVVLLTAFKIMLRQYAKQDDIVVGATFANRGRSELESIVGYFVTLLPLRTRVEGSLAVPSLLRRVSETASGAISHQALPLNRLVTELGLARDPSRTPLFQVVFYLLTPDHNPAVFGFGLPGTKEVVEMDDIELTPIETECHLSRFDLMFLLWDLPEGLFGTVEYSTDLFDDATIGEMIDAFHAVLPLVAEHEGGSVDDLTSTLAHALEERRRRTAEESKQKMSSSLSRIRSRGGRRRGGPADADGGAHP